MVKQGNIYWVILDPTVGSEVQETRPCLIISPDEMNQWLRTVSVAPLTSQGSPAPFRIRIKTREKAGFVLLDQIRTVDKGRLTQQFGALGTPTLLKILTALQEMFKP